MLQILLLCIIILFSFYSSCFIWIKPVFQEENECPDAQVARKTVTELSGVYATQILARQVRT